MIKTQETKKYDLEDRTLEFGKRIIKLAKALPKNSINGVLVSQIMRSGTSVGANYREANETSTKKDFLFRMSISKKEAKETHYWLDMVIEANPDLEKRIRLLSQETDELIKIFASIILKSK